MKIENENQHQSLDSVVHQVLDNLDSYEPDGAVESLESAELDSRLVETKIEVDKFPHKVTENSSSITLMLCLL